MSAEVLEQSDCSRLNGHEYMHREVLSPASCGRQNCSSIALQIPQRLRFFCLTLDGAFLKKLIINLRYRNNNIWSLKSLLLSMRKVLKEYI